ncbi:Uncharacterised protein [Vibrio cholerae]|nr:Uncharacterised protein [Vibrio cholerae]
MKSRLTLSVVMRQAQQATWDIPCVLTTMVPCQA